MEIGKSIYNILAANTNVGNLVGTRIFPNVAPQTTAFPFIIYDVTGVQPNDTKDGVSTLDTNDIMISCYSETYSEASDLADVLSNRPDQIFNLETQFKSWTINDVVGHLYLFDVTALKALEGPKKFTPIANGMDNELSLQECQYRFLGFLTHRALFGRWKKISHTLG